MPAQPAQSGPTITTGSAAAVPQGASSAQMELLAANVTHPTISTPCPTRVPIVCQDVLLAMTAPVAEPAQQSQGKLHSTTRTPTSARVANRCTEFVKSARKPPALRDVQMEMTIMMVDVKMMGLTGVCSGSGQEEVLEHSLFSVSSVDVYTV